MPELDGSINVRGFQFGELTPALWGRADSPSYMHGTKTARNVYIQREGGLTNRPGTIMVAPVNTAAAQLGRIRLLPFIFSNAVSYALEFGHLYMRVYRAGAQIQTAGKVPYEIVTPYAIGDLPNLQYVQLRNILYLACAGNGGLNYPVQKLICGGDTNWTLTAPTFTPTTAQPGSGQTQTNAQFADPTPGANNEGAYPWFGATSGYWNFGLPNSIDGHFDTTWDLLPLGSIMVPGSNGIPTSQSSDSPEGGLRLALNRYMITAVDLTTGAESFPMQGTVSGWKVTDQSNTGPIDGNAGGTVDAYTRYNSLNSQPITSLTPGVPLTVAVPDTSAFATNDYFTFQGTGIPQLDGNVFQGSVGIGNVVFTTINADNFPTNVPVSAELICLASQVLSTPLRTTNGMTPNGWLVSVDNPNGQPTGAPGGPNITLFWNPNKNGIFGTGGWSNDFLTEFNQFFTYQYLNLSWHAPSVTGDYNYFIYRQLADGQWGLIGTTEVTTFQDTGLTPNPSEELPDYSTIGNGVVGNPAVIGAFQQRLLLANTPAEQDFVYCSNVGEFETFTTSNPTVADSDTVQFEVAGSSYNPVTQLTDNAFLLIFTSTGELSCFGAGNAYAPGPLTPTAIGLTQQGYYGANQRLRPITIGKNVLYIQSLQSKVRELIFTYLFQGYVGADNTVFSEHLFDGYTMVDWCYQQEPNSIVWVVRNDGALLSFTYLPEQNSVSGSQSGMKGWTRHDTLGTFESICAIPEGTEHALYAEVLRNGTRFIERFSSQTIPKVQTPRVLSDGPLYGTYVNRNVPDWTQWNYMDCAQFYDGRNGPVTFSEHTGIIGLIFGPGDYSVGGAGFTLNTIPVFDFYPYFSVGQVVAVTDPATGVAYQLLVTDASESPITYTVRPLEPVPLKIQNVLSSTAWAICVNAVQGLSYLPNGTQVAVLADGQVLSSYTTETWLTVQNGIVTLPGYFGFVRVGLPFLSDIRTLDIDTLDPGQTSMDKEQLTSRVACYFKDTRGCWLGTMPPSDDAEMPLENLVPLVPRFNENLGSPPYTRTGIKIAYVDTRIAYGANAFVRQPDPLPMTITAIVRAGRYMIGG